MAKPIPQKKVQTGRDIQAIGLKVGNEEYAVKIGDIREIVPTPHITRVPTAPDHIIGVINLRGRVIPVIDIARRLGIGETRHTEFSRIVAVEIQDELVGVIAEQVSKVAKIKESQIKPPPPLVSGIAREFIDGVCKLSGRVLIFLKQGGTQSV